MEKKNYRSDFVIASETGNIEDFKKHYLTVSGLPTKKEQFYFALYFASFNGQEPIVKFLLSNKVDPNYVVGSYLTPLHAAILKKHDSIVELLLEHGANVEPKIKVTSGKKKTEANYFCSPLICACVTLNEKVIKMLLERGANVMAKLQMVKEKEKPKTSHRYLTRDSRDKSEDSLNYGTFSYYELTNNDSETGKAGSTPLHLVIRDNKENLAKILLDHGADINAKNDIELTPLCVACERKDTNFVEFLFNAGADLTMQVNKGKHLLCYVIQTMVSDSYEVFYEGYQKHEWVERCRVFSYLLKIGADPNGWSSKDKESALHRAAHDGNAHAVHLLLKHGANANAVDGNEKTPLECSVDQLKELLEEIQGTYSYFSDSSSDDDYESRRYMDSDEADSFDRDIDERREARAADRKRQDEKRKPFNLAHNTYAYNVYHYRRELEHSDGFTIYQDPDPFRMISQLLTKELVRLEAIGTRNCQQNVKLFQTPFVKPYYTRCKNELKKLKKNVIADGVNYHDFLLANDAKLKKYLKNKNIVNAIDKENCRKLFPNYCRYLRLNVKRGLKRKKTAEDSDGSSDEEVGIGSVQMRGRAKRPRFGWRNDCFIS